MTDKHDKHDKEAAELFPCPFCGSHGDEVAICKEIDGGDWFVRCYVCHVETVRNDTESETIAAWNRRAALTASEAEVRIPEGWKLVPAEPTEEMHVAAVQTITRCTGNDDFPPRVWRAMLAAAPSAPVQQEPVAYAVINGHGVICLREKKADMLSVGFREDEITPLYPAPVKQEPVAAQPQEAATIADLKGHIEYLQACERALRAELNMRRQKEIGEVWYWQHDGGNHVESLTCPIVIPATEFLALTQAAPSVPVDGLKLNELEARLHKVYGDDWLFKDDIAALVRVARRAAQAAPSVPEGWKLVPIDPTENMVTHGFESRPDPFFSAPEEWDAFEAMSGCQRAAHCARLCWAAMLAAAPPAPSVPDGWQKDLMQLLISIRPAYGAVGSRDVGVNRQQEQIDAAIAMLAAIAAQSQGASE